MERQLLLHVLKRTQAVCQKSISIRVTLRPLSYSYLLEVTDTINHKPRKIMGYTTPAERLQEELADLQAD